MKIIFGCMLGLGLIKLIAFWLTTSVRYMKKEPLSAEEVIKCKGMRPDVYKSIMKDTIVDYSRDSEIEQAYNQFVQEFKVKMKAGEISRGKILGIREYLNNNVDGYIKTKFNNDAHAIYTMLKASDLQVRHIKKIEEFLAAK